MFVLMYAVPGLMALMFLEELWDFPTSFTDDAEMFVKGAAGLLWPLVVIGALALFLYRAGHVLVVGTGDLIALTRGPRVPKATARKRAA